MGDHRQRVQEATAKAVAIRQAAKEDFKARQRAYVALQMAYTDAAQRAQAAETALEVCKKEYESAKRRVAATQDSLQRLHGLFTGKRRRELEAELARHRESLTVRATYLSQQEKDCAAARAMVPEAPVKPEAPDERELTYQCAEIFVQAGLYGLAWREYDRIRGYRDVDGILQRDERIADAVGAVRSGRLEAGDLVTFGRYQQKGSDVSDIVWLVLSNDGATATMISLYGLDVQQYHDKEVLADWSVCSLRKWLNGAFLDSAFSAEERAKLAVVTFSEHVASWRLADPQDEIRDLVFLPSISEVEQFFDSDEARVCCLTEYALNRHGHTYGGNGAWWLRSSGSGDLRAAFVGVMGGVDPGNDNGGTVTNRYAVRPLIALKLSEPEPEA